MMRSIPGMMAMGMNSPSCHSSVAFPSTTTSFGTRAALGLLTMRSALRSCHNATRLSYCDVMP